MLPLPASVYARGVENLETTSTKRRNRSALQPRHRTAADPELQPIASRLSTRQLRYCLEYLVDFNQTQAAIRAGFSKRSAQSQATDLMKHPVVSEYLSRAVSVKLKSLDSDSNALMRELARLAHVDLGKAFLPDGSFLPLAEMHEDVRRCIAGIETEETYETRYEDGSGKAEDELEPVLVRTVIRKIKFWDKNKAADTLAKCMKLFSNGSNVTVNLSLETLVMQSIPTAAAPQVTSPSARAVIDVTPAPTAANAPGAPDGQQAGLVDSSADQT